MNGTFLKTFENKRLRLALRVVCAPRQEVLKPIVVTASAEGLASSNSLSIPMSADTRHLPLRVAEELSRHAA